MTISPLLSPELTNAFADCALHCVQQRYPYAMPHLMRHAQDHPDPALVHPIFCGSYDWHSSVHMHWSLLRLLRITPKLAQRERIIAHFAERFTSEAGATECHYLNANPSFERPYGWAWLMQLHAELLALSKDLPAASDWAQALQGMVDTVKARATAFLTLAHYPQRAGMHANSAFAMTLFSSYANRQHDSVFADVLRETAMRWFGSDLDYAARFEPSGADFLSGGLCEAMLMSQQLDAEFLPWWQGFAPSEQDLARWLEPAIVSSRVDGQLVHLDGLNLSRAWCLLSLAARLPQETMRFEAAAQKHLQVALPHVTGGDFVATHWLVSFALLALTGLEMGA